MKDKLGLFKSKPCWWKDLKGKSVKPKVPTILRSLKRPSIEKEIRSLPTIEEQLKEWNIC